MEPPSGRKVVIDAGAAIKLQRLECFGGELLTTGGVLREVRDERARALLQTLPHELRVREPLPHDLAFVRRFARATGDLGFLSQNDLELLALTVSLHLEAGGQVREAPLALASDAGSASFDWAPAAPPARAERAERQPRAEAEAARAARAARPADAEVEASNVPAALAKRPSVGTWLLPRPRPARVPGPAAPAATGLREGPLKGRAPGDEQHALTVEYRGPTEDEEDEAEEPSEPEDEDGSSAGEWVTPENMHRFGVGVQPSTDVRVTCATADYSVQNVLLQMGITPLTFDGYAVHSVKLWGVVCRGCFFFSRDTQKMFCPKCGHNTLVRVPIVVDHNGQATALNSGRPLRRKGTVYSVPKPQGGRGWKPIFAEDELRMGSRDRELRHLQKVYEKERQSRNPFNEDSGARAWYQRGTTSTGKMLATEAPKVQAGYGRQNPNANNFRGFAKRKKR